MKPGPPSDTAEILQAIAVSSAGEGITPLREITLRFAAGSFNLLRGPPRTGKNLLLRILGLLQLPESGDVLVEGRATRELSDPARAELRNHRFGYIFSAPFLLSSFTVLENVAIPLFRIAHLEAGQARQKCEELLEFVGLSQAAHERVGRLSAAAQHGVALARSLANTPALIIVEDLTQSLNSEETSHFFTLLRQVVLRFGTTIIGTVPAEFCAERDDRVIELADGVVRRDGLGETVRA